MDLVKNNLKIADDIIYLVGNEIIDYEQQAVSHEPMQAQYHRQ